MDTKLCINKDGTIEKYNLRPLKENSQGELSTMIPLIDWEYMKTINGGAETRTMTPFPRLTVANSLNGYPRYTVFLKDSFKNYKEIVFHCTRPIYCDYTYTKRYTSEELDLIMKSYLDVIVFCNDGLYFILHSYNKSIHYPSDKVSSENIFSCSPITNGIVPIEIYGIK